MLPGTTVHVCGVGDHVISDISLLTDPCPPPGKDKEKSTKRRLEIVFKYHKEF